MIYNYEEVISKTNANMLNYLLQLKLSALASGSVGKAIEVISYINSYLASQPT